MMFAERASRLDWARRKTSGALSCFQRRPIGKATTTCSERARRRREMNSYHALVAQELAANSRSKLSLLSCAPGARVRSDKLLAERERERDWRLELTMRAWRKRTAREPTPATAHRTTTSPTTSKQASKCTIIGRKLVELASGESSLVRSLSD